ncbi:MAG: Ig-like domain-containing protein [Thermoguttaceae bacterium]
MKLRRRLLLEPLEQRALLDGAIGGAVFEDLDRDAVRDVGEPALEGWTVQLQRTGGELQQSLFSLAPAADDQFGRAIAALGDDVLIGAYHVDVEEPDAEVPGVRISDAGAAYRFDGMDGRLLQTFVNPTPEADDRFGRAVAAEGDRALIGAYLDDTAALDAGAAYLMDAATGELLRTLLSPNPGYNDQFGRSVAMVGGNPLIGARLDNTAGYNTGAAYLFDGSTGELLQSFFSPTPAWGDQFGYCVAALGNHVAIGARYDGTAAEDGGAVYLFDGSTGRLLRTFLSPTPNTNGAFGRSVALVGDSLLIGARFDDTAGEDAGAAYLFDVITGELLHTLISPAPAPGDEFGYVVTAVGSNLLIGARLDDTAGEDAGAAYLFDGLTGDLLQTYVSPAPAEGDRFGVSLAAVGTDVLIGVQSDDTRADDGGAAYRFEGVGVPRILTTDLQGEFHFDDVAEGTYQIRQLAPPGYAHTLPEDAAVYAVELLPDARVLDLQFGVVGNERPQADGDAFATDEDLPLSVVAPGVLTGDTDADGDALTARPDRLPAHGTLTLRTDGSFAYVPDDDFFGEDTFTYVSHDGWLDSDPATVTITVRPIDDAPTATGDYYRVVEDGVLHVPVPGVLQNDEDADSVKEDNSVNEDSGIDGLIVRPGLPPSHGTLTLRPDGSFDYTPSDDFFGTDYFTYVVSDGLFDSDEATVTITVAATYDGLLEGTVFDDLDRNGVRDDGEPGIAGRTVQLQHVAGTDPLVVETDALGQYRFTGFELGTYRIETITPEGFVQTWPGVSGGRGDGSHQVTVIDDGNRRGGDFGSTANTAPAAIDDAYLVDEDSFHMASSASGVLANDSDANGDRLTAAVLEDVQHGILTFYGGGAFFYFPEKNFHGTDRFTYRANDGLADSNVATVVFTVDSRNDVPAVDSDDYRVIEDGTLQVDAPGVLIGDVDADGDAMTVAPVDGPLHGTLWLEPDGSFRYVPQTDFFGTDRFTYRADDGVAASDPATVTITVTPVYDGQFGGTVFEDLDADGVRDVDEQPLGNWAVELQRLDMPGQLMASIRRPEPRAYDSFGRSVAALGDNVLVGTYGNQTTHAADLFDGTTGQWLQTYLDPSPEYDDQFGYCVAAIGQYVAVGDPRDSSGGYRRGAVFLFDGQTGAWDRTLLNPSDGSNDGFGSAMAAAGTSLFVGAPYAGRVYQFDALSGQLVRTFADPAAQPDDFFGSSLAVLGDRLVVGASGNDTDATNGGAVYLFDTASGTLLQTIVNPTPAAYDAFGLSVAGIGEDLVVGSARSDAAYLFDGETGRLLRTFEPPEPGPGQFGYSVAVVDGSVLIGSPIVGVGSTDAETAYLFDPASGKLLQTFERPTPATGWFGYSVAGADGRVFIGASSDDTVAGNAGAVFSFQSTVQPQTTVTDADGRYLFSSFEPGTYQVRQTVLEGYLQTTPLVNTAGAVHTVTIADDADLFGFDFGNTPDERPTAGDDFYGIDEDDTLVVEAAAGVLVGDRDADGDAMTATPARDPIHGTLDLRPDGSFDYTPERDFFGTDTFTYFVTAGQQESRVATVWLTVRPVNDVPAVVDDAYMLLEGDPLVVLAPGVLDNDVDVENTELSAVVAAPPTHGRLTLEPDGSFVYVPERDFFGADQFTYRADDGEDLSAPVIVTLDIAPRYHGLLGGTLFDDLDRDTLRGAAEPGLGGWSVELQAVDTLGRLQQTFVDPTRGDSQFGRSVAAYGENVLVGAYRETVGESDEGTGAVYLFDLGGGGILQTFRKPDPEEDDRFGRSMAAVGDRVAVGAYLDDLDDDDAGAAYLFDASTGNLLRTLHNPTPEEDDQFGRAVAAVGENVLVGARFDDSGAEDAGAAYLFDGQTGRLLRTFLGPAPAENDQFGYSVAAVGDKVLVGARYDDTGARDAGAAYLFDARTGELLQTFLNPTPQSGDAFGRAVAGVGDNVLVGARYDDTSAEDSGAAYLFDATTGRLLQTFLNPSADKGDEFGYSVAAVGDKVLIGARRDDTAAQKGGAAYLFDAATGVLLATYFNPQAANGDRFGVSVAAVGDAILVGAQYAGAAYLFAPPSDPIVVAADAEGNFDFTRFEHGTYQIRTSLEEGYAQTHPGGNGAYVVTIGDDADRSGFDFGAVENVAPVAENDGPYDVVEDGTLTVEEPGILTNDRDGDGDRLKAARVSGPAHGTLALELDGSFVYTPADDFSGTDSFSYRADDGLADSGLAVVTITVHPVNDAPVAVEDHYTTYTNLPLSVPQPGVLQNDVDVDGDPLTATLVDPPSHGTVNLGIGEPISDGSFLYTPAPGFFGVDSFTYTASDGQSDSAPAKVTIVVLASGLSGTVFEDGNINGRLDPGEPGLQGWSVHLQEISPGDSKSTTQTDADGYYSFVDLLWGTYLVSQTTQDGYTQIPRGSRYSFVINVLAGQVVPAVDFGNVHNRRPVALDDAYGTNENTPRTIFAPGVLGNDLDPDGDPLTAVLITGAAYGSVSLDPDGSFRYEPRPDFVGIDRFTYQAAEIGTVGMFRSNTATVEIQVDAVNEPPLASGDSYQANETFTLWIDSPGVLTNDSDPDGDLLTAWLVEDPAHGTLTLQRSGAFRYRPDAGFIGDDTFAYRAKDQVEFSEVATARIRVTANTASIGGTVFDDLDLDGVHDADEPGLEGWTVRLEPTGAEAPPGTGIPPTTVVTDAEGNYQFAELPSGTYAVGQMPQQGWEPSLVGGKGSLLPPAPAADDRTVYVDGPTEIPDAPKDAIGKNAIPTYWELIPTYASMPEYIWHYGCSPTAAGMILGWWDAQPGTTSLFEDDAATWWGDSSESLSGGTRAMIASTAHILAGQEKGFTYGDWRNSVTFPQHEANPTSLADFMKTRDSNTFRGNIGSGMVAYAGWDLPWTDENESYQAQSATYYVNSGWTFDDFREEIDRGYPVHLGINALTGHSIPAIGYWDQRTEEDPGNFGYVAYTTWQGWGLTEWRWDGQGVPQDRAVYGATYLRISARTNTDARIVELAPGQAVETVDLGNRRMDVPARVVDRHVFYNNSAFDGRNPAADARDDAAIAPDKEALLPGETATKANYINYVRGINGVMIDVVDLPDAANLSAIDDFVFRVGNNDRPDGWSTGPSPSQLTVRHGAGVAGSDRVTIVWADNRIDNRWLQVTVLATQNTGLAEPDVFHFGNAIGEAGDQTHNAIVNATDEIAAKLFSHGPLNPAAIDDPYDYNRDRLVNATDRVIARAHQTNPLTMLRLITIPPGDVIEGGDELPRRRDDLPLFEADWFAEFDWANDRPGRSKKHPHAVEAVDLVLTRMLGP